MRLEFLTCERFRNLADASVELGPQSTLLLGDNGQGKTSFLEAIGVLATTRSFRRARPQEVARHGERGFSVHGRSVSRGGAVDLTVRREDSRRTTLIGTVEVELAEYAGQLSVVAVTSVHAGIVRGAPQDRRDFLDRGVLSIRPGYLRSLAAHRRTLRQKNALLRRVAGGGGPSARAQLEAWNARLAEDAAELVARRRSYVADLRRVLEEMGPLFLPPAEQLELSLDDALSRIDPQELGADEPDRPRMVQLLRERMDEACQRELASGTALVGPHRDELSLTVGGRDVRRFSSSGQQRNALLALKVAKVELARRVRGESPLLLVDDIDTEIDPGRLGTFLEHVAGRAQTVITSSKGELFANPLLEAIRYTVREGLLIPA